MCMKKKAEIRAMSQAWRRRAVRMPTAGSSAGGLSGLGILASQRVTGSMRAAYSQ